MLNLGFWMERLKGGEARPPSISHKAMFLAGGGGFLAIALVGAVAKISGQPLVLGSLGASCVMLFAYPDLPFSQPRHVVFGHLLSSLIGLACLQLFGDSWWSMGLAMGLAIVAMVALGVVHPPAGSNPVIVFLSHPGWSFIVTPVLFGVLVVLLVALVYNNLTRKTAYPKYW